MINQATTNHNISKEDLETMAWDMTVGRGEMQDIGTLVREIERRANAKLDHGHVEFLRRKVDQFEMEMAFP